MKRLYTSKLMSRVFSGMVLALAVVLVACGSDSDEPTPTATTEVGQAAAPTVPPLESTPDSDVNEDEITVLDAEVPSTPDESTPNATEEVEEASVLTEDAEASPDALTDTEPADAAATAGSMPSTPAEDQIADLTEDAGDDADAATPPADSDVDAGTVVDSTPSADAPVEASTPDASSEGVPSSGPGDGTGGSGMLGELEGVEEAEDVNATPQASPQATPAAQLTISGCEVPDVPGFLGESNTFILTEDLNFRTGPGVACDLVFDDPIGVGQTVEVLGGPVTQADDDSEWVYLEINGEPGWITTEFLEPTD